MNSFYSTAIATYFWVLSNSKPEHRRCKVQLIDTTQWFNPLRKNLGKKNCELSEEDIQTGTTLDHWFDHPRSPPLFQPQPIK